MCSYIHRSDLRLVVALHGLEGRRSRVQVAADHLRVLSRLAVARHGLERRRSRVQAVFEHRRMASNRRVP
jgi:hypothetical protein